jgi:PAS domain S-box-containing protein
MIQKNQLFSATKAIRFLITFLLLMAPIGVVIGIIYALEVKQAKTVLEIQAANSLKGQTDQINREFQVIISDLKFLAQLNELKLYLQEENAQNLDSLASEYLIFSSQKQLYDQIRFLDQTGLEIVRVNFNAGRPSIVSGEQLQNKSNRYYFQDTFRLAKGEIFVSPFDLNVEKGNIEQPLKPMIRFGLPVFDSLAQKRGIVLLNYLGNELLTQLKNHAANAPGQVMLLNAEGFWLMGVEDSQLWGFMYGDRTDRTFGQQFPAEWLQISQQTSGQFYTKNGLFTFVTIYPLVAGQKSSTGDQQAFAASEAELAASEYYWKVVSYLPPADINTDLIPIRQEMILVFLGLGAIGGGISWWLTEIQNQRAKAEAKIQQQNEFLNNIINSMADSFYVINVKNYQVIVANAAAQKLGDPHNKTCYTLTHHRHSPCLDHEHPCPLEIIRETKQPVVLEHTHFDSHGQPTIVEVHGYPIFNEQGDLVQMIEYSLDITARKQAEEELRKLSQAVEQSANGILITDLYGKIEYVNPQFTRITGYTAAEVQGKNPRILNSGKQSKSYYQELWQTIRSGREWRGEFHNRCKDGSLYWAQATISPIFNAEGQMTHFLGIQEDITARKEAESALRDSEAKLRQQTQELAKALEELRHTQSQLIQTEKMSSLGQLVAGIAHEINNPVNFIHGNIDHIYVYMKNLINLIKLYKTYFPEANAAILEEIEDIDLDFIIEDIPQLIGSMKEGSNRIKAIVYSLRIFSHTDEMGIKSMNIHDGLDSTLVLLQPRLNATANRPEIQVQKNYGDLPLVPCYAAELNQVFMNIITNAIDALEQRNSSSGSAARHRSHSPVDCDPSPSVIQIITESRDREMAIVRIIDNGVGIPESVQPRVFDPFFTTKEVGKGTGLGLSISYKVITEKHKGKIECFSKVGQGTEFVVTLPISAGSK